MIQTCTITTPLGPMTATAEKNALKGLWFIGQKHYPTETAGWAENPDDPVFDALRAWLSTYFSGKDPGPSVSTLSPEGTAFQKSVWNLLLQIPYGHTTTYGNLSRLLTAQSDLKPTSPRAVGTAVGRNPISLLIPCHRVIGSNKSLTGYAAGLDKKQALLKLEGVDPQP